MSGQVDAAKSGAQAGAEPEVAREFSFELPMEARPEDVWRAISEGAELQRWFPMVARVRPGVGGSVLLSWGPGCEGEAPITIWEPGRRLGWREKHDGGAVEVTAVWEIVPERGGASCSLRVTQSGFGRGAKWADHYDSISSGWKFELRSLRHYLARHGGKDRAACWVPVPTERERAMGEVWGVLAKGGGEGVCREGTLSGHREGAAYRLVGPDGRAYSGTVLRGVDGRVFAGTVRELDDGLIRVELEPSGGRPMPCFWVSWWGGRKDDVDAIGAAWRARIAELVA